MRSIPTEYLLNNFIDKELQDVLFPLNMLQSVFLLSKYIIISNFITPKNRTAHIKSIIGVVVLILYCVFYLKEFAENFRTGTIYFLVYVDVIIYSVIAVVIHVVSGVQTCNAVDIVIKLQQILNTIRIDKRSFLSDLKVQNWISIVSLLVVYIGFVIGESLHLAYLTSFLASILLTFCMLIYDLQIVELICTVVFITNTLAVWNQNMKDNIKRNDNNEGEIHNNRMLKAYADIVKTFNLCNKVFQFSITHCGLLSFINVLIELQIMLEFDKMAGETIYYQTAKARLLNFLWNLKNIILLSILSVTCESFYRGVRNAEYTCLQILVDEQCADVRKTCKNVLRLNGAVFRKLSAFGIFEIDAAFPVRLLGCLVPYTVVLLQFALL